MKNTKKIVLLSVAALLLTLENKAYSSTESVTSGANSISATSVLLESDDTLVVDQDIRAESVHLKAKKDIVLNGTITAQKQVTLTANSVSIGENR